MNSRNMLSVAIPGVSNLRFSAVRPESLQASEYTLVTIVVDLSSSVASFIDPIKAAIASVVDACKRHARAENLLLRVVRFNSDVAEVHGFKPLADIDAAGYAALTASGMTALFDAGYDAIGATEKYAQVLDAQDYDVNAAVYILTDGMDNRSSLSPKDIAGRVRNIRQDESLESILTILVGINTHVSGDVGGPLSQYLEQFRQRANIDQYVDIQDASPSSLSKLAGFVSRSISSQSQALGTGSPSQLLNF